MVAGPNSRVFFSELHYDNDGTDEGEFIEIANAGGLDLTGWNVTLYNGATSAVYGSPYLLSGSALFPTIALPSNGLQNGAPDGFALTDSAGALVQFLSYEGTMTALDGPAAGATSTDIGMSEGSSTPRGTSLQLGGTGSVYGDFSWQGSTAATAGTANANQVIEGEPVGTAVFINEIHYDNDGVDTAELVEVAGPAGTNLSGWTLVLYNGNNGASYRTIALSGSIPDQDDGYGTISAPATGIQNGSPDGVALVDANGAVVQFLSYEGSFVAVGGPADGMTSSDIGVAEASSTPVDFSLQLSGSGVVYEDFTWSAPAPASAGAVNGGQDFAGGGGGGEEGPGSLSIADADVTEGDAGTSTISFVVTRSGGTSGSVSADWAVQLSGSAEADDLAGPLAGSVTLADGETSGTIEIAVAGDLAIEGDEDFTVSLTPGAIGEAAIADGQATGTIIDDDLPLTEISAIQGATHTSTFAGERVTTSGIVTAVDSNGFYLQDQTGDGDVATSEAIFVFTGSAPTVAAGDEARVTGTVSEYVPGGASSANLSLTQLTAPQVTVLSSGNALPSAVVLGVDRIAPTEIIEDDNFGSFDPATDGIDFYESLEGMLVAVRNPLVVAPTNNFGEIWTVANDGAGATNLSDRGTMVIEGEGGVLGRTDEGPGSDYNPERIQIDDDANLTPGGTPDVIVGAKLADITGVVSYSFGNYEVIATSAITVETASTLTPETTTINGDGENLTVASYNVLNLDPNDGDGDTDVANGQFALIAEQIVYSLNAPDIVALQEVQDNSGSASDGTVSASVTLQMLADAIEAEGGPSYMVVDNPFIGDNTNGGQPGGNIRTAYLYNPERVDLIESSVRTIEGDGQQTDPSNPFYNARLPLVATFVFNEAELTLVNNHFSSKGGSSPLYGSTQDALNGSAEERFAQAEAVADFVTSEEALVDGVVVLGDLNEFQFEDPLDPLYDAGLLNLMNTLPEEERYSYLFEGNAQALDEFFVSEALSGAEFDVVHANAEFGHEGASDHDPLLASFFIPLPNDAPEAVDDAVTTARKRPVEIDVLANDGDADGDLLTIVGLSDPAKGSAELDADGTLTYTPDKDFKRGSDTFEYTIADGAGGFDTGSVTVTIDNTGPKDDMLPVTNYKVDLFGPAGFLAEGEHGQSAAALAAMEAAGWVSHGSIDPVEGFLNGLRGQSSIGYLPEDLALFV